MQNFEKSSFDQIHGRQNLLYKGRTTRGQFLYTDKEAWIDLDPPSPPFFIPRRSFFASEGCVTPFFCVFSMACPVFAEEEVIVKRKERAFVSSWPCTYVDHEMIRGRTLFIRIKTQSDPIKRDGIDAQSRTNFGMRNYCEVFFAHSFTKISEHHCSCAAARHDDVLLLLKVRV